MSDLMYENSLGELCVKAQRETAENERSREEKGRHESPICELAQQTSPLHDQCENRRRHRWDFGQTHSCSSRVSVRYIQMHLHERIVHAHAERTVAEMMKYFKILHRMYLT